MSGGCSSPRKAAARAAGPAAPPAQVAFLRDEKDLDGLVPAWEALAAAAAEPNPFYEHWLLRPALRAYAPADAGLACVSLGGELAGVFPLERIQRWRGLPFTALRSWRHRHCVLGTPLVREGRAAEALAALFAWARTQASVLEFDYTAADGPFQAALLDALDESGLPSHAMDGFTRGIMRRAETADAYVEASLSKNYRIDLRRFARRLAERGELRHSMFGPGEDVRKWVEGFLALEAKGWKGANGTALACRPEDRQFALEAFGAAAERGRFLAFGVDVGGRPVSRVCGFSARPGSFMFKTAYDEEFAKYSPGAMVEVDWTRAMHSLPGIEWTDSFTSPRNTMIKRLWKDSRTIHRVAVGLTRGGGFGVAALPLLRFAKSQMRRGRDR